MQNFWLKRKTELQDDLPVFPPWNTNTDLQDAPIVFPKIYGLKTPEKHKFIFVDNPNTTTEGWDN